MNSVEELLDQVLAASARRLLQEQYDTVLADRSRLDQEIRRLEARLADLRHQSDLARLVEEHYRRRLDAMAQVDLPGAATSLRNVLRWVDATTLQTAKAVDEATS